MRLKDQVCSLELAKKLKELGVPQESAFYYAVSKFGYTKDGTLFFEKPTPLEKTHDFLSAFTVAELGEMLPKTLEDEIHVNEHRTIKGWASRFWKNGFLIEPPLEANTEADARAKMLIYLIEHGLVKPEGK